jgi:hypothetical protein
MSKKFLTPIKLAQGASNPAVGSAGELFFNTTDVKVYAHNGTSWVPSGGGVTVSATAPATPIAGDAWYDTVDGTLYVYYNDGDSSQWVEVAANSGISVALEGRVGVVETYVTTLHSEMDTAQADIDSVESRALSLETRATALELADATTNKSGLVPIIPSSVSVNAGSASVSSSGVISFTGCVTLTINNVFSSLYSNYYVICSAESTANATDIYYRLVEPSGTILSSYFGGRYSVNSSGVNGANWNTNIASAIVSRSNGTGGFALQSVLFNPYENKIKRILTSFFEPSTAGNQGFYSTSTASHTSLIIRSDQAMNTGTVTIYGMR